MLHGYSFINMWYSLTLKDSTIKANVNFLQPVDFKARIKANADI